MATVPTPPEYDDPERQRLADLVDFVIEDVGPGFMRMAPREARGTQREYFKLFRLADATTRFAPEMWDPLREHPPYQDPNEERRQRLLAFAASKGPAPTRLADAIEGLQAAFSALHIDELAELLESELPKLFDLFPNGSLWLMTAEQLLLSRLVVTHGVSSLYLASDMRMNQSDFAGFSSLDEHSLTRGVSFAPLVTPLLLSVPNHVLGYAFDLQPQTLVLLFGEPESLVDDPVPRPFSMLYDPGMVETIDPASWIDEPAYARLGGLPAEALLQWWVGQLNVFYTYMVDPRNFQVEELGIAEPRDQRAYLLTFERMVADAISAVGGVHKSAFDRLNAAFDFFDKAEALLGYGRASSGRGFKTLVTRGVALRQLDGHLRSTMSDDVRKPLFRYATDLFDQVCREVRDGVVEFRRRENAILVEPRGGGEPKPKPLDDYTALLIRAVRDSAHGLLAQLRADEGRVIGIHRGGLPAEVALLPGPLLLGFAAGAEAFTATTWLDTD